MFLDANGFSFGLTRQQIYDLRCIFGASRKSMKRLEQYLKVLPDGYPMDDFIEKCSDINVEYSAKPEQCHKLVQIFLDKLGRWPDPDEVEVFIGKPKKNIVRIINRSIEEKCEPINMYHTYFEDEMD